MTTLEIIVCCIAIYLLSFMWVYHCIQVIYSKDGISANSTPDNMDIAFTVVPGLNTIFAVILVFIARRKRPADRSKFFRIKRQP